MYYNPYLLNSLEQQYANNPLVQQNLNQFDSRGQMPFQQQNMRPQTSNSYALVHGLQDAKNYPVVPNCTCILFDDERSEFYKKTVDSMGAVELRLFEYNEKQIENANPAITDKAELESLKSEIAELKALLSQKQTKESNKRVKNGDKDELDIQ